MEEGLLSLKWNNHRSSFLRVLSSLRNKEAYTDVTLACEGNFYPSHKLVLSTCSEYFNEMFQITTCKHPIVVLKDIPKEDLEALLNYMYLGEVNVLQERLTTLIKSAECLRIKGLAVQDDLPDKPLRQKREADKSDTRPESKRRCAESDHRKKGSSRDYSSLPRTSLEEGFSISSSRVHSFSSQDDKDSRLIDSSLSNENLPFIKQEVTDYVCIPEEDSKESLRDSINLPFSSPHSDNHSSSRDGMSKSDDQWAVEDSLSCQDFDPGDKIDFDASNEPSSSQTDMVQGELEQYCISAESKNGTWCTTGRPPAPPTKCYGCPACGRTFDHKGNFKKHLKIHTGEKPFKCSYCEYRAIQKIHLIVHMRTKHNVDLKLRSAHSIFDLEDQQNIDEP